MHLLHIDSSIQGDRSVSRRLSARAADVWRAAHPEGTVTYRDLGSNPVPHLDAAGAPRHGWDHAGPWLPHALAATGLQPRFITAELTLATSNPAMAALIPLAEQSLAEAERAVDGLWTSAAALV
jgi:hypothetical protein